MSNPRDLFLQLLSELMWTERTLAFEVLPKLHEQVKSQGLARVVAEHLEQTREHARRLEQVFAAVGAEASSNLSPPVEKLQEHHDRLTSNIPDDRLADCFHAIAAVTAEHHEIAAYAALLRLAAALDLGDARGLLEQNRAEEAQAIALLQQELERLVGELPQ